MSDQTNAQITGVYTVGIPVTDQEREGVPSGVETGIRLITPDADRVHANLERRGVEVGEMLRWPQTPAMFEVRDQDGNRFEIVEQT
jgi:hypothetical protein